MYAVVDYKKPCLQEGGRRGLTPKDCLLGPFQEQYTLLTAEPSLLPPAHGFLKRGYLFICVCMYVQVCI